MNRSKILPRSDILLEWCFNPCSLGWIARRRCQIGDWRLCSFNPCSLGWIARRAYVILHGNCHWVSILVLLDESLEVQHCKDHYPISISFNPCSLGWIARRRYHRISKTSWTMFQSLFSWMNRSKNDWPHAESSGRWFQSLFSWMNRSKAARFWPFSAYFDKMLKIPAWISSCKSIDSYLKIRIRCRLCRNSNRCTWFCICSLSDKILCR